MGHFMAKHGFVMSLSSTMVAQYRVCCCYDIVIWHCDGKVGHNNGEKETMMVQLDIIMAHHSNMMVL